MLIAIVKDHGVICIKKFYSLRPEVSSLIPQGLINVLEDASHNKALDIVKFNIEIGGLVQLFDLGNDVRVYPKSVQSFNKFDMMDPVERLLPV
eukprot:3700610-Karenia_brevis.AAC.1